MLNKYEQQCIKIKKLEEDIKLRVEKFGVEDKETQNRIFTLELYKTKCERN